MGTGCSLRVKRPGRGVNHTPPSSAEVTKGWRYTSIHPLGQFRPVTGLLYLLLLYINCIPVASHPDVGHRDTGNLMAKNNNMWLNVFINMHLFGLSWNSTRFCNAWIRNTKSWIKFHCAQCSAFPILLYIKDRCSEDKDQDHRVPEDSVQFKLQCTCISVRKLDAVIYITITAAWVSAISNFLQNVVKVYTTKEN
jgi:hypothetical protein